MARTLASGVTALALAVLALTACALFADTGDLTGACTDCTDAGPANGDAAVLPGDAIATADAGAGEIFASGQTGATSLARDDGTLYWACAAGVASCSLAGCAAPTT